MKLLDQLPETRPKARRRSTHADKAKILREHPGMWGIVRTGTSTSAAGSTANAIKTGRLASYQPAGSFESVTRGRDIWARYVGEAEWE